MSELINEAFIISAAAAGDPVRFDARGGCEFRNTDITFGPSNGQARVRIGSSYVSASVTGEVTPPAFDRPNEGKLFFNVDLGQIAAPSVYEYGRALPEAASLCNHVERVLRGSKAIDVESLCILGGKSVWSVRVDIQVLNDDGSLEDACALVALCGLLNFRHESVAFNGEEVTVFSESTRDPVPLSVHHLPFSVSYVLFRSEFGIRSFVDPSRNEEDALRSKLSLVVNQHGELCGVNQPGGITIDQSLLSECCQTAIIRARWLSGLVKEKLVLHSSPQDLVTTGTPRHP